MTSIGQNSIARMLICAVAILLSLTPVSSESLWWEISRGRAVADGIWTTSAELIQQEQLSDSDLLAGAVPWLIYDFFGVHGLMILKLVVATIFAILLSRQRHGASNASLPIVIAVLIASGPAVAIDHRMADLLGLIVAWNLATRGRPGLLSLLAIAWVNYSIAAIWCIPAVWVSCAANGIKTRRFQLAMMSVICALCVNFRGPMAILEMLRVAVPSAFYDRALLADSGVLSVSLTIPNLYAAALCAFAILQDRSRIDTKVVLLICCLVGIFNVWFLPHAAVIAGLAMMAPQREFGSNGLQPSLTIPRAFMSGQYAVAGLAILVLMSGGMLGSSERFGWGIADSLDHRLFLRDLGRHADSELLVHASDTNGAGLMLFTLPNSQVVDVAEIAIKRGRFHDFAMLNYDLSAGRKTAYARSDGGTGGWWDSLINGKVDLLAIAASRSQVFAALEPTLWKPLALDTPIIVLGQAGSRKFTPQIIDVRSQRDVVDLGSWQHRLNATIENRSHADFWQMLTGLADSRSDTGQAEVFRSMSMLNAAVRTILPVLKGRCRPTGRTEFLRIQQEFVWQEKLHSGMVSQWRTAVLKALNAPIVVAEEPSLKNSSALPVPLVKFDPDAVRLYCEGEAELAAKMISGDDPESLFALQSLHWHAGNISESDRYMKELQLKYTDHALTLAVERERGLMQQ